MVNHKSGLLGVSDTSSDMRDLLEHEKKDVPAAEAVALFCYQALRVIRTDEQLMIARSVARLLGLAT